MGNWAISIEGVGCHHNNKPFDVERLVAKFVDELKANGHTVSTASVHYGGKIPMEQLERLGEELRPFTDAERAEVAEAIGVAPEQIGDPISLEEVADALKENGETIDQALENGSIDDGLAELLRAQAEHLGLS